MELLMANRLTREYINSLPIIRFEGEVVVVTSESQAEESLDRLMGESCVGFDTESRPSFTRGTSYPISVLQFSTDDTAYLFQLKKTGFPDKLVTFLEDKDIKKIGVGIKNDIEKLQELREFTAGGFVDLSKIASDKGIIQVGLRGLAARYTSHRITKTAQKTNWAHPQLTWKQQIYAASDAWICLLIYPRLLEDGTNYRQFIEEEEKKTEAKKTKTKKSESKKIESKKNESKKTESKKVETRKTAAKKTIKEKEQANSSSAANTVG